MATKEDIADTLSKAREMRELNNDLFEQMNTYMGIISDDSVMNYINTVKLLKDNLKKVSESRDSKMKDLEKLIVNEIAYSDQLDELYFKKLAKQKISYSDFMTEFKILNGALRDSTIQNMKGTSNTQPTPTPKIPAKPERTPQFEPTPAPPNDDDSMEEALRQIREQEEKELREKELKAERDRSSRIQDKATRDAEIRRENEQRDKQERERKEREKREREDRERREKERKDKEEREKREKLDRERRERELREMEKKKAEDSRVNRAKKIVDDTGFDNYVSKNTTKDGKGPQSRDPTYDDSKRFGEVIGKGKDTMISNDAYARLIANGVPGMLNQDKFGKLIGGTMPSIMNERNMASLIGSSKDSMINQYDFGRLIGQSKNSMLNQDGFGKTIGLGLPSLLAQDDIATLIGGSKDAMINENDFAKLLGSAMKGMTTEENERIIAEKQNQELRDEIKKRDDALEILNHKLQEVVLEENQIKDKLHNIRVHRADVKTSVEKLRQENEEKKDELSCLKEEVKSLEKGIADLNKELMDIEKTEKDRLNVHKELKSERDSHKEALQKLEIEIQSCKSSYEGLMRKWQEEIEATAKTATEQHAPPTVTYHTIGQPQSSSLNPSYKSSTSFTSVPLQNNFLRASNQVELGGSVWRAEEPRYITTTQTGNGYNEFSGSKYAAKYLASNFKS
jgi:hypothetical protein